MQRVADLVLVAARLGLDRERHRRLGELDPREREWVRLVGEGVAGERLLELRRDPDLAGAERLHVLLGLALQPRDVAEALPDAPRDVQELGAGGQGSRADAEQRALAAVAIGQALDPAP